MPEGPESQRLASDKRQARTQRIRDMRMRIAAIAVALFVTAWAGLYIQLVSGHDPALAGTRTPVTQSADPDAAGDDDSGELYSDDTTDDGWSDGASDDGWGDSGGWDDDATSSSGTAQASSSAQPGPVTSGQS
jgi:hypothetical protein